MNISCKTRKLKITKEECLKCANEVHNCNFTYGILNAMFGGDSLGNIYRVSTLSGGCPRKVILQRTIPYYVAPEDLFAAFRGTMIHKVAELKTSKSTKIYTLNCDIEGVNVTGTIDEYETKTGILRDYKSVNELPRFGAYQHHTQQIKLYAYLLKKQYNIIPKKLELTYLTFKEIRRINVPNTESMGGFLKAKILLLKTAEEDIFTSYAERGWECNYCPPEIARYCNAIELASSVQFLGKNLYKQSIESIVEVILSDKTTKTKVGK